MIIGYSAENMRVGELKANLLGPGEIPVENQVMRFNSRVESMRE